MTNTRRALRVQLSQPTVVMSVGQPEVALHPNLARVYQRVQAAAKEDRVQQQHRQQREPEQQHPAAVDGALEALPAWVVDSL